MRRRRSITDRLFWLACAASFVCIAVPSVAILSSVFHQARPVLGWSLLTHRTNAAGLQNAILGSLLLLLGVLVMAGTVGVASGIYLAEYATGRVGRSLRFCSEVLAGSPSIVIGYIAYAVLVVEFHWGFSLLAAVIALSVLVTPYIVRTTELALRQIPTDLRSGAAALGSSRWTVVRRVVVPPAVPGIVSGLVLALAISTGELAPLLFTAGFSDNNPTLKLLHHQVPYLTDVTFTNLSLPGAQAHAVAAAAGTVTLCILLILIGLGRLIGSRARRRIGEMTI